MAFDRRAGGHSFDFSRDVCAKCGMTRELFEDNGKPPCQGKLEPKKPIQPVDP
jgi:hypothetical protein